MWRRELRRLHCADCFPPLLPLQSYLHLNFRTKAARRSLDDDDDDEENRGDRRTARGGEPWDRSFRLDKGRGQHLLTNPRVLDSIARLACLRLSDTVLEIGPGTGNLTVRLLQSVRRVVAIEIDPRMVESLLSRVSGLGLDDRLTVITGDALRTEFPEFDICVANIPYGISSPLIAKLLYGSGRQSGFRSAVLLLQKEFAKRLVATPGDSEFNRLAANVMLVATVEMLMNVSKKNFVPCPKVDSSLVRIQPRSDVPDVDLGEWLGFTRTCFTKKNKTLGAIFKQKKMIAELYKKSKFETKPSKIFVTKGETLKPSKILVHEEEDYDGDGDIHDENDATVDFSELDVSDAAQFKEKINRILKSVGYEGKRPSKLSNQDFLHLLQLFNQEGILFR